MPTYCIISKTTNRKEQSISIQARYVEHTKNECKSEGECPTARVKCSSSCECECGSRCRQSELGPVGVVRPKSFINRSRTFVEVERVKTRSRAN